MPMTHMDDVVFAADGVSGVIMVTVALIAAGRNPAVQPGECERDGGPPAHTAECSGVYAGDGVCRVRQQFKGARRRTVRRGPRFRQRDNGEDHPTQRRPRWRRAFVLALNVRTHTSRLLAAIACACDFLRWRVIWTLAIAVSVWYC